MITSAHNPRLKELRKLHDRKHRERTGLFTAEGEDLLAEALRFGVAPRAVFHDLALTPDSPPLRDLPAGVDVVAVEREALERVSALGSGTRLIGLWEEAAVAPAVEMREVVVYMHEISDPGNVGSVLRSALALAPSTVVLSPGSSDPFAPKAVRASMGAVFGQPFARMRFDQLAALTTDARTVALVPGAGTPLPDLDLEPPLVFCLGAERAGLPEEIAGACDERAHVPMRTDGAESLNVAMTATLCLYQTGFASRRSCESA